ncbi:neutrophil gelatinase-associated lipocalin-like [Octodon degus]|uniref:Neutrophil gelatinase-associated lipocalin-like n=1 Tax=Octodon degus TaxID=10160 RepID=A0A6P6DBU8_OCTDE|nr:neutrophil gelatinase-associated lipocalin-like [Octodon degus]
MADEKIQNETKKVYMHSVVYNLRPDGSYHTTTRLYRPILTLVLLPPLNDDPRLDCHRFNETFSLTHDIKPFIREDTSGHLGVPRQSKILLSTNYNEFAVLSIVNEFEDNVSARLMLYGRNKTLTPQAKEHFDLFVKYLDLTDENIFFYLPTERCIDDL